MQSSDVGYVSGWFLLTSVVSSQLSRVFLYICLARYILFLPSFPLSLLPFCLPSLFPPSLPFIHSSFCFDLAKFWNCLMIFDIPLSWLEAEPVSSQEKPRYLFPQFPLESACIWFQLTRFYSLWIKRYSDSQDNMKCILEAQQKQQQHQVFGIHSISRASENILATVQQPCH